jgi:hypothetical protein
MDDELDARIVGTALVAMERSAFRLAGGDLT